MRCKCLGFEISSALYKISQDVKIRCFCPSAEMVPACDTKDPSRAYEGGDLVKVVVLEVKVESQRLLAGMHITSLPPLTRCSFSFL